MEVGSSHPEDRAWTNEIRAKRFRGEEVPREYEARGLTKDRKTIWIHRRNSVVRYDGRPAILGNIVNITEQKRAEEELRRINQELKNFVRVVSHDLKTPIISIEGFASRLLKNFEEALGERGRGYVTQINASARRMEMFVSDLLAISTIGHAVSDFEDASCLEIVENVLAGLQDRFRESGIKVVLGDNLPVIHCDAYRIYQVFENLLVNAMNFLGNTNNPKIEVGYEDRGEVHQFFVRDNGVGIHPTDHRRIFDMFYRIRESAKVEGTGLGLAIVEKAIKSHGGKVWVESERGKGATFYFALPKDPTPG
ncbi:MAG: PAS domain S-box protein [Desulfobacterales bacterium]|nr:MAG: PAS domain S-box protein [Desulfobacterales bacterium]